MGQRKVVLREGCFYHVFSRSIAGFEIFRSEEECRRMIEAFRFYQHRIKPIFGRSCNSPGVMEIFVLWGVYRQPIG